MSSRPPTEKIKTEMEMGEQVDSKSSPCFLKFCCFAYLSYPTRHNQFVKPVNVLNIKGRQECRMSSTEIEKQWNEILKVISKVESRDEALVMISDLNWLVGDIVPGNSSKVSYGCGLLGNFLMRYILVNGFDNVEA